jgi:NADPH:quinone reductase-like Zn-dependent oxidoreductase
VKAAVCYKTGGPDVFKCEEQRASIPAPMQVLVEVKAISIEGGEELTP